jgi:hypothetical protein
MRTKIMVLLGALLLLGAGFAAACSSSDTDDLEERLDAVEAQLAEMNTGEEGHTDNAAILGALLALRSAGLHELDEATNDEGTIPDGAAGGVSFALVGMNAVEWPDDLAEAAADLTAKLEALSTALESEDAEQVAGPAAEVHEAWHDFDHDASAAISGGHDEGEGDHEEGTPMADMTPEAGG